MNELTVINNAIKKLEAQYKAGHMLVMKDQAVWKGISRLKSYRNALINSRIEALFAK